MTSASGAEGLWEQAVNDGDYAAAEIIAASVAPKPRTSAGDTIAKTALVESMKPPLGMKFVSTGKLGWDYGVLHPAADENDRSYFDF